MSGEIRPTTRRYLQFVARNRGLEPGDLSLVGQELTVDAQVLLDLDAAAWDFEGQAFDVNQRVRLDLDPGEWPWEGTELVVLGAAYLTPMSLPWAGQNLVINERTMLVLDAAAWDFEGQTTTPTTTTRISLVPMALPWTGELLVVPGVRPPALLKPRWRIRLQGIS